MPNLTKLERDILDELLKSDVSVASQRLNMKKATIRSHLTNIRKKVSGAKRFLKEVKPYNSVLYQRRAYKHI